MQTVGIALVCALVGTAASAFAVDQVDSARARPDAPTVVDDEPQCTTRSDCPWAHVCRWGHCDFIDCGSMSTCQKGTEEYACCPGACGIEGGCAGDVPNPPSCPGHEVRCGSICCPYMYACLDPNTGQCGINY